MDRDERDRLIAAVSQEVLTLLAESHDVCRNPEQVRSVVANGADRVSYHGAGADVPLELARYIDHTLLVPDATAADIDRMCAEAIDYGFASVCVNPTWVSRVARDLRGSSVLTCSVVGFPFGATSPQIKA